MWIKLKMINFYVSMFIVSFASFHCPLHSNHLCSHFNAAVLLHLHFTEFLFIFQMIHLILCLYAENRQANFRMSCILQYCIPSFFVICFERKNKSIWLILCFSWNRFGKMSQKDSNVIIITLYWSWFDCVRSFVKMCCILSFTHDPSFYLSPSLTIHFNV